MFAYTGLVIRDSKKTSTDRRQTPEVLYDNPLLLTVSHAWRSMSSSSNLVDSLAILKQQQYIAHLFYQQMTDSMQKACQTQWLASVAVFSELICRRSTMSCFNAECSMSVQVSSLSFQCATHCSATVSHWLPSNDRSSIGMQLEHNDILSSPQPRCSRCSGFCVWQTASLLQVLLLLLLRLAVTATIHNIVFCKAHVE